MAIDWMNLLRATGQGLGTGLSRLLDPSSIRGVLGDPQALAGGGLLLGGSLSDREPGEVTEARQYLRNLFTSPTAIASDVAGQTGALASTYEPLLRQQERAVLDQVQQAIAPGIPSSIPVAMGGPEIAAIRQAAEERLLPRRQALLGELGLGAFDARQRAARDILSTSRPDPTSAALSQLGMALLLSRGGPGGALGGLGVLLPAGSVGGGFGVGGAGSFPTGLSGAGGGGVGDAFVRGVAHLLGQGSIGGFHASSQPDIQEVLDPQGRIIGWVDKQGNVASITSGGRGNLSQVDPSVLTPSTTTGLGPLESGLTGAAFGIPAGLALGGRLAEPGSPAPALGAGLGALLGGAVGSPFGPLGIGLGAGLGGAAGGALGGAAKSPDLVQRETVQGALGGAFGGLGSFLAAQGNVSTGEALRDAAVTAGMTALFGPIGGIVTGGILGKQRGARLQKAQFRTQDVDSQRDQVNEIGNVGATILQQAGVSPEAMQGWQTFIDGATGRVAGAGDEQGEAASELNRLLTEAGYPPGRRPQAWRQQWIDYLVSSTFTAKNSRYGGGAPLNFIGAAPGLGSTSWLARSGLRRGGMILPGGMALTGESGPELVAHTSLGSLVVPMESTP